MSITLDEIRHYAQIIDGKKENSPLGTLLSKLAKKEKGADPVADIREIRSGA
ncbi:MAG: hypothetical protein ACMUHU_05915 [Thermoplasmatota archaeon]